MQKLNTIDGATLMTQPFTPMPFVIESLLSQGLHILAGSPKVGKSWLALWLSVQVANGDPIWGMPVKQGTTLYLCLEDSTMRIQNRLLDVTEDAPESVHFCTECKPLGQGLEEQLEKFIREHPDTVLIIIDTFQMIRGNGYENTYANDYRDLSALKKVADAHGVAILLIHHMRKEKAEDDFAQISGTTGIMGAVDSGFTLVKDEHRSGEAILSCRGRDIESRKLTLHMNEDHVWDLVSDSREEPLLMEDHLVPLLSALMAEREEFCGTPTELVQFIDPDGSQGISVKTVRKRTLQSVGALSEQGILARCRRSDGKRLIELRRDGSADLQGAGICDPCDPVGSEEGENA